MGDQITHPDWCDPRVCRTTERDTEHGSTSVPVVTGPLMWEARLYRLDDHGYPEVPGEVQVCIEVTNIETVGQDAVYHVPFSEVTKITGALSCLYTWGLFHSETVRP